MGGTSLRGEGRPPGPHHMPPQGVHKSLRTVEKPGAVHGQAGARDRAAAAGKPRCGPGWGRGSTLRSLRSRCRSSEPRMSCRVKMSLYSQRLRRSSQAATSSVPQRCAVGDRDVSAVRARGPAGGSQHPTTPRMPPRQAPATQPQALPERCARQQGSAPQPGLPSVPAGPAIWLQDVPMSPEDCKAADPRGVERTVG